MTSPHATFLASFSAIFYLECYAPGTMDLFLSLVQVLRHATFQSICLTSQVLPSSFPVYAPLPNMFPLIFCVAALIFFFHDSWTLL